MMDGRQLRMLEREVRRVRKSISPEARALLAILRERKEPAVQAELAATMRLPASRIRELIRQLRRAGHPVCSSSDGCFLNRDPEARRRTIKHLKSRALSMWVTAAAMEKAE